MNKNCKVVWYLSKKLYLCTAFEKESISLGEVAEWSNAAVLKTVVLQGTGGSNPSLSARRTAYNCPSFVFPSCKSSDSDIQHYSIIFNYVKLCSNCYFFYQILQSLNTTF